MWQKLRLYCACRWGEGRADRPGKHMPLQSRALSAQRLSLTCEWSSLAGEKQADRSGIKRVKLRSQPGLLTQVVTQNSSPGA